MTTDSLLEELKARLDILDVVSDYVEIKRSGQNYKGLCPFHSEKTPSFMVSPEKQIFHCFGCGVGGNIIHFIMKYENLSFHEALRHLAKKAGISLRETGLRSGHDDAKERLTDILREASKIFRENLVKSKSSRSYLDERGLSDEAIGAFGLGYAIKDWHSLTRALRKKGIPESLILQSGIASSGDRGMYDIFRDRIMFPIAGLQGDIIAFGGRVMDGSEPKYLNSPDTPLFRKGETLYALNLAKDGIREKGSALIVEGYFDVIACHQHGFRSAVAPLGTSLTSGHLRKLKRFTKKAVLVFDADAAGKAAAKRSLPLLFEEGFSARILLLPEKDDPDSYLRRQGGAAFERMLSQARSVIDFIFVVSGKDKTETVRETLGIISAAGDAILRENLLGELSEKTGIRETVLREEMKKPGKKPAPRGSVASPPEPSPMRPFVYDEEILLLSAALAFPGRLVDVLRAIPPEEFRNPSVRTILEKVNGAGGARGIDSIVSELSEEEKALVTRLSVHPGFDFEAVDRNIEDCARKITQRKSEEKGREVHERIKEAERAGERELSFSLLPARQRLIKEAK